MPPRAVSVGSSSRTENRPLHQRGDAAPVGGRVAEHQQAQVAEHLRRLSLAQQHVDAPGAEGPAPRFSRPDIGWSSLHVQGRRRRDGLRLPQGPVVRRAVDQLVALVAEAHRHPLDRVAVQDAHADGQRNVPVSRGAPRRRARNSGCAGRGPRRRSAGSAGRGRPLLRPRLSLRLEPRPAPPADQSAIA